MVNLLRAPTREYRTSIMDSHRWDGFRPRADDIVVATYGKSGTTWVQRIVDLLIFQTSEARPVMQIAPWLDAVFLGPVEPNLEMLEAQTHRRSIKTHLPLDAVPFYEGVKYLHIGRGGLDVFMSLHNHLFNFRPEMKERMANAAREVARQNPSAMPREDTPADPRQFFLQWIKEAEDYTTSGFGVDLPYFEFENTYWRERRCENLLFVHYNDLKTNLEGEMHRIADFVGIAVPQKVMSELVQAASFDAMKKDGAGLAPAGQLAFDKGADTFFNKGTNNRWKGVLTAADVARYETLVQRKWSPALRTWIENGRRVAGEPRTSPD